MLDESNKNVLILAPQPFFAERGTPFNVRAMARALGQAGYKLDLLVYPLGEDISLPNVRIIRSPSVPGISSVAIGPSFAKIVLDIFLTIKALLLCFKNRYQVIHGIEEGGFIAFVLAKLKKSKFIYDMDSCMTSQLAESGFLNNKLVLFLLEKSESFVIKKSDSVITVCEALTKKARAAAPKASIHQIEDCPLEEAGLVNEPLVNELSQRFRVTNNKILLYTGNLKKYQGVDLLLEAGMKVLDKINNVLIILVGGSEEEISLYKRKVIELGIQDKVIFEGTKPPVEMGSYMEIADVLVSPRTQGENTPLKIYSYMQANKPLVATDIYSHTQVLNEQNAFLAKAEVGSFAKALENSLVNENLAKEKAKEAYDLVVREYSEEAFGRKLIDVYRGL